MEDHVVAGIKIEPDLKIKSEFNDTIKIESESYIKTEYDSYIKPECDISIKTEEIKEEKVCPEFVLIKQEFGLEDEHGESNDASDDPFGDSTFVGPSKKRAKQNDFLEKCPKCNIDFYVEESFVKHILLHQGIDALTCKFCLKVFQNDSDYKEHQKEFHKNETPFVYPKVTLRSSWSGSKTKARAKEHDRDKLKVKAKERNKDINEMERSVWQCGECKMVVPSSYRNMHLLSHKEYRCKICGMYFYMKDELVQHTSDMHNERIKFPKEMSCYICKEKVDSAEDLKLHLKSRHIFNFGKSKAK